MITLRIQRLTSTVIMILGAVFVLSGIDTVALSMTTLFEYFWLLRDAYLRNCKIYM